MERNLENGKNKLLVVVDMVNGFCKEGPMADPSIMKIVDAQIKLIEKVKREGGRVIFVKEGHDADATEFAKFPVHCVKGTKEAEIIDELKKYADEADGIYEKNSTSAIFAEGFLEDFEGTFGDVSEVIVAGCCTDICDTNFLVPLVNYCDEINRKVDFVMPIDVCETYDAPFHKRDEYNKLAYKMLKQAGVKVVETYNEEMKEVTIEEGEKIKKLIDFYEITMAYSDFLDGKNNNKCYFDVFFRKNLDNGGYNVASGLQEIIEFIENFKFDKEDLDYLRGLGKFNDEFIEYLENFKFNGDIFAIPDGTPVFPGEPCITVVANSIEAQLIETDILNRFNHGSMITTKTRRIVNEAEGRPVLEFGARRAQGDTAAVVGAKHAYIGGAAGTSCYEAGKVYDIPLLGTMAHSHIMKYETEEEAFSKYAKAFPDSSLFLVDTYDTLQSGVPNAIKVAREVLNPNGRRLQGIRLDSGDLAYLAKEARLQLDEAGMQDAKICASNSLDEFLIRDLLSQGAPIDSFGVGENLITSKSCPVFGGVYKLAAIEDEKGEIVPKIKLSNNVEKVTNPGYKKVYRFFDKETGYAKGDVIALHDEIIPLDGYRLVNDKNPWQYQDLANYEVRELQVPIYKNGELVYEVPTVREVREYADREIATLYPEVMRLNNPHEYYVDLSERLAAMKNEMLQNARAEVCGKKFGLNEDEKKTMIDATTIAAQAEIDDEDAQIEDIAKREVAQEEREKTTMEELIEAIAREIEEDEEENEA